MTTTTTTTIYYSKTPSVRLLDGPGRECQIEIGVSQLLKLYFDSERDRAEFIRRLVVSLSITQRGRQEEEEAIIREPTVGLGAAKLTLSDPPAPGELAAIAEETEARR